MPQLGHVDHVVCLHISFFEDNNLHSKIDA